MRHRLLNLCWLAIAGLSLLYGGYFVAHSLLIFGYPFPLDYGEGPLLLQAHLLREGQPLAALYRDPALPPYQVVNYPPVFLFSTWMLSGLGLNPLLAGRLLSLLATIGCLGALAHLSRPAAPSNGPRWRRWVALSLLLSVPIVREWAVLMRVDLLGIALGLWALVALQHAFGSARPLGWAMLSGLLLALSLATKPSLVAAPLAAGAWLLADLWTQPRPARWQRLRIGLALSAAAGLVGGGMLLALEVASGGWFLFHTLSANANRWEAALAWGFWRGQLAVRWPLLLAAALAIGRCPAAQRLPVAAYLVGGLITALGVGKVGAYSNYFLEGYCGLIWLIALAVGSSKQPARPTPWGEAALLGALLLSMAYYPPLWDPEPARLRPAGLLEPLAPRLSIGRYGLWDDQRREAEVLGALARSQAMLNAELRASGPLLLSDQPGLIAAVGGVSRLSPFEIAQLVEQGLHDPAPLLSELSRGQVPLAAIDYLGNWLSPAQIAILSRRYAQDGAHGNFDLLRPIALGPSQPLSLPPEDGIQALAWALAAPADGAAAYESGQLLTLGLTMQRTGAAAPRELRVVLRNARSESVASAGQALLYNAFPPAAWPLATPVEHLQTLALPPELEPGNYTLEIAFGAAKPFVRAPIALDARGGRLAESSHFVPGQIQQAWAALGGLERAGHPLTPAVPFAWGTLQCFERLCLELRAGEVQQRPLGAWLYAAETRRSAGCGELPMPADGRCPQLAAAWERHGASLGAPLSGLIERNGYLVQWSEYGRVELDPQSGTLGLGRLGDDIQRLPPGQPYRWP